MLKKILMTGLSALFSVNAFAVDQIIETEMPLVWQPIVTLSGGPTWASPGQSQYLYPSLPFSQINYYIANSNNTTFGTGEIFFGLQRPVFPCATGELGIGIGGSTDADVNGTVTVNGISGVSNYDYKVNNIRTELKGRLIANSYRVQPYISGGFGAGWNHSHDFRATTINPLFFPNPWFGSNSNVSFTYNLGIGADAIISRHWAVGVGYEFADWGRSYLEVDTYTNIPGPYLTHLYTNEVVFRLSYLI